MNVKTLKTFLANNRANICILQKIGLPLHSLIRNDVATLQGVLTERLGNGLQNRVERFDSARHLIKKEVLQ